MKNSLCAALVLGVFVVLTSFAVSTRSAPTPAKATSAAWTVSQYQLDRAFRNEFSYTALPLTWQNPPSQGFIITQVKVVGGNLLMRVAVNGLTEDFDFSNSTTPKWYDLTPPIVVRPNDTFSITQIGAANAAPRLTFAGYSTLPGET